MLSDNLLDCNLEMVINHNQGLISFHEERKRQTFMFLFQARNWSRGIVLDFDLNACWALDERISENSSPGNFPCPTCEEML